LKNEPESDCVVDLVMDLDHSCSLYQEIERIGLLLFDRRMNMCDIRLFKSAFAKKTGFLADGKDREWIKN
jgi:hypothetical protein